MSWQDSEIWEWWLEHGFDGIGAGVVGGAVTGAAIWLTLRHERRLSARNENRADLLELRAEASRLYGRATEAFFSSPSTDADSLVWKQWLLDVYKPAQLTEALSYRTAPALNRDVAGFSAAVLAAMTREGGVNAEAALSLARKLANRLYGWLMDPDTYDELEALDWDALLAAAESGPEDPGESEQEGSGPQHS